MYKLQKHMEGEHLWLRVTVAKVAAEALEIMEMERKEEEVIRMAKRKNISHIIKDQEITTMDQEIMTRDM